MPALDLPLSDSKQKFFYVSVYYENAWLIRKVEAALKRVFKKRSDGYTPKKETRRNSKVYFQRKLKDGSLE